MVDKFLLMLFLTNKNKNKIFYSNKLHLKKINNNLLLSIKQNIINKNDYLYKN